MFYFLLRRPFRMESRIGFLKALISFLVASFLLFNVFILPFFNSYFLHHDERVVYLNILESPQFAQNVSYLCKFKINKADSTILSYNQSYDGREITISTGAGDFQKKNCKQYFPGYLFNDYSVSGTIINVFYNGNMNTVLNATVDSQEIITVTSDMPMRVFIRNKKAVLVQQSQYSAILMKGIARLDRSVKEGFSFDRNILNYSSHFSFKDHDRTIHNPKVIAYELPLLNEIDVTSYATFGYNSKFTVGLQFPQKRGGEGIQSFFKIEGKITKKHSVLSGFYPFHNSQIAAYDYIDTDDLSYFNKFWYYGKPFVYGLLSLFVVFFLINLYSLKSGVKLTTATYGKPHLDDVIRQASRPVIFEQSQRVKQD